MERKLIDVSHHLGKIDWTKVKGNVDGAIIRCGYGSDLEKQDDEQFIENVNGCMKNGIPFGVYLYSYAETVEQAKSEAAHVLRLIKPFKDNISYPVYLDLEEAGIETGAVERAIVFGDIIEANGYWCGIYANQDWWKNYLKDGLDRFTKWVARYSSNKPEGISGTYDIWQYSNQGSVAGVNGNVDVNICYRDLPSEIRGTKTESASVSAPTATTVKTNEELAEEVKDGKWGNGEDRKNRLAAAGYDYDAIQAIVNKEQIETETIAVGKTVKVKSTAVKYATGETIPSWVKTETYTVQQLKDSRALLKEIESWVNISDLKLT